jgi:hypothetical protein
LPKAGVFSQYFPKSPIDKIFKKELRKLELKRRVTMKFVYGKPLTFIDGLSFLFILSAHESLTQAAKAQEYVSTGKNIKGEGIWD